MYKASVGTIKTKIVGVSPISFSKAIQSKKETGEGDDAFEERTWLERLHVDANGEVFIPPNAVKNMLRDCAKYLGESIKGKGRATWTKHFQAGIMIVEPCLLGLKSTSKLVQRERLFVPSDGKPGGSKRVWKNFPTILNWETTVIINVLDPLLIAKPEKIEEYLRYSGKFIGLLRWRPRNGGYYGRFDVSEFTVLNGEDN